MADAVMVEIPVTPEAAEALGDSERRERIGKLVSGLLRPQSPADDPLAAVFASIKSAARTDELTDEEIEAELAAYNAERSSLTRVRSSERHSKQTRCRSGRCSWRDRTTPSVYPQQSGAKFARCCSARNSGDIFPKSPVSAYSISSEPPL